MPRVRWVPAAEIFVPAPTPTMKVARIASYGARVVQTGATYADALTASRDRQAETGALEVHAYDHPDVLAGQGTVGREFEQDAPELTHVLVATGGGGLIGGIAAWYAGSAQVVSVEPEACPTLHDALRAGHPVEAPVGGLAADSLGARQVGGLMFPIAQAHVAAAVLVPDAAIAQAQRVIWDRLRLIAEPGGATALAALLCGAFTPPAGCARRRAGVWCECRSREGCRSMSGDRFLLATDGRGIATLTLNRPEVANAYDEDLLRAMTAALETIAHDAAVRALVIRGAGKHFQAGADINWLNRLSRQGPQENYTASIVTVRFSKTLNELPKPTMAVIHGACFGGGVGIACCVDVALATPDALFAISEVRHGIAPTPISTHMVNAIGLRQTRRYALTGERFGAEEAARIGLVHEVVAAERMEARLAEVLDAIVLGAPGAIAQTKLSFLGANGLLLGEREVELLAHEGWMQRQSAEGQEGTTAFREKRKPGWYKAG